MNLYDSFTKVNAVTAADMAKQAGLDFDVEKRRLAFKDPNNNDVQINDKVAIVRTDNDNYLGTVGIDYGIIQFQKMLDFTEILVSGGEACYVSGRAIGAGEKAAVVMKTQDKILLGEGDEIECYFYITTSHNSTVSLDVVPAPLRKVNNTILLAPEGFGKFKFRHTKNAVSRLDKAKISIAKVKTFWDLFEKSFRLMSMVQLTPTRLDEFWKLILPNESTRSENIRERMDTIFKTHPAYQFPSTKDTLLGAYLAVIEYVDNEMGVRVTGKKNQTEETAKLNSLIDGQAARRKAEAFAAALRLQEMFGGGNVL